ncbi:MAG TPA: FixH family protein [Kofleriaceae bacterium]|jgi:hypothetical protein
MRLDSLTPFVIAAAALAPLAACGSSGGSDDGSTDHVDCATEKTPNGDRPDDFVVGLSKQGDKGLLSFKMLGFDPAPPSISFNDWQVEITAVATVAPMSNASLDVYPFMPKHGHGAGVDPVVTAMPTAGEYDLDQINLHMPGIWEVTITATTDAGTDSAVFRACLPN